MIRKFLTTVIKVVVLLWLIGWVISVGPHAAWLDVAHLATNVYSWVHATASAARGPAKVPATPTSSS